MVMALLLGLMLVSTILSLLLFVPFIDFLYRIRMQKRNKETLDMFGERVHVLDKFTAWKVGTPHGGGVLILLVVTALTIGAYGILNVTVNPWMAAVLFIGFVGFGLLGLLDDVRKLRNTSSGFFGLTFLQKFAIQWMLALMIACILQAQLHYSFLFVHYFGVVQLGVVTIPFLAFVIVSFSNAVNITDGIDGLATGLLIICLMAFLTISASQLDLPLGIFIAILIGGLLAFLYFNIFRARVTMGDTGALSLGAVLAVVGLLTGKIIAMSVIGAVFIIEVATSALQLLSWKYRKKPLFPASPLHLWLQNIGWEEAKVAQRLWIVGVFFALVGLYIAFIR